MLKKSEGVRSVKFEVQGNGFLIYKYYNVSFGSNGHENTQAFDFEETEIFTDQTLAVIRCVEILNSIGVKVQNNSE